jgi:hypothetical protein
VIALRVAGVLCCLALAGCGGAQRAPAPPRGTLRFEVTPAAAIVEVDEVRLGPASMLAERGLLLAVGQHRVVVTAEDCFPEYRLVEVAAGAVATVKIELVPTPE